jgi:hypothetical protein
MRNSRLTVLLRADEKAAWEARAARRGVSSSEFVRQIVNDDERVSAEEEAELALLVREANEAIPKMSASIERITQRLEAMARKNEAFFRKDRDCHGECLRGRHVGGSERDGHAIDARAHGAPDREA